MFSRPCEPIAAGIGSCANDLPVTMLIIRLSADNGTISQHSACTAAHGFAWEGRRVSCPSATEVSSCGDSRPTERGLTAIAFGSSCDRAEG